MEVEDALTRLDGASDDLAQMQELLHFLKGSALNLGFRQVCDMCSKGEVDAGNGSLTVDAAALKALYSKSRTVFEAEYKQRFAA
jgi:HPt (histidine-containing phosphotransfer) domain-containing protein